MSYTTVAFDAASLPALYNSVADALEARAKAEGLEADGIFRVLEAFTFRVDDVFQQLATGEVPSEEADAAHALAQALVNYPLTWPPASGNPLALETGSPRESQTHGLYKLLGDKLDLMQQAAAIYLASEIVHYSPAFANARFQLVTANWPYGEPPAGADLSRCILRTFLDC